MKVIPSRILVLLQVSYKRPITKEVKGVTLRNKFPSNHFHPLFEDFTNIKPGSNKIVVLYFRNSVDLKWIVLLWKVEVSFQTFVHISYYTISTNAKPNLHRQFSCYFNK
jgi:hypothetical protein